MERKGKEMGTETVEAEGARGMGGEDRSAEGYVNITVNRITQTVVVDGGVDIHVPSNVAEALRDLLACVIIRPHLGPNNAGLRELADQLDRAGFDFWRKPPSQNLVDRQYESIFVREGVK